MPVNNDTELTIVILADGVRPDVLRALADAGEIPNIGRSLYDEGYGCAGVTVLPSVSNIAYIPMLTGQYPGTADVPGLRWVEKSRFTSGKLLVGGHRSYLGPGHVQMDGDLSPETETIFQLNPDSLGVRCDVRRGLTEGNHSFSRLAFMPFMACAHYLRRGDFVDRIVMSQAMKWLARTNDRPSRFIFLPLVDVDKVSHRCGPDSRNTIAAYKRLDAILGVMLDWLRRQGLWQRTRLILTSDHGHTRTERHLDITRMLSELDYGVFEYPNVYRRRADAAVMVSGNSFANIYLPSLGRWESPLTSDELEEEHDAVLQALAGREEIEWYAYRRADGRIKIVSQNGEAALGLEGDRYAYCYNGVDPLRLGLQHNGIRRSKALEHTIETDFPDALEQIWHLFKSDRTGDIIVTAKNGYDLRGWREFPEHRSSHGALSKEHMAVPIISNRPLAGDGGMRTVDIFSTVAGEMGLTPAKPHFGRDLLG